MSAKALIYELCKSGKIKAPKKEKKVHYYIKKVENFEEYVSFCTMLRDHDYWSFRGQRNHAWRPGPHIGMNIDDLQKNFQNFKARCMEFPRPDYIEDTNSDEIKEWRWLFYAQHHRLKTRLLDWTSNPLVSLYFAVEEITSQPEEKTRGAVWALNVDEIKFKWEQELKDIDPNGVNEDWMLIRPPVVTHRIARQSGLFSFHTNEQLKNPQKFCKNDSEKRFIKIEIGSRNSKKAMDLTNKIRRTLGIMNIHHASLFPHPEGVANFLNNELHELKPKPKPKKTSSKDQH